MQVEHVPIVFRCRGDHPLSRDPASVYHSASDARWRIRNQTRRRRRAPPPLGEGGIRTGLALQQAPATEPQNFGRYAHVSARGLVIGFSAIFTRIRNCHDRRGGDRMAGYDLRFGAENFDARH
jgi:hypothetical protein